jgi:hypothetical protein
MENKDSKFGQPEKRAYQLNSEPYIVLSQKKARKMRVLPEKLVKQYANYQGDSLN